MSGKHITEVIRELEEMVKVEISLISESDELFYQNRHLWDGLIALDYTLTRVRNAYTG